MTTVSDISQGINALYQQDTRRAQKAVYDEQLRGVQAENAQRSAVGQQYTAMVDAFRQNGGNLDALAPLVKDEAGMKAFASFVDDYARTEEGRKKAMDATTERATKMFQTGSGYIQKALSSSKGSPEWVANVQNAAASAPFTLKLGEYDQNTDSFEMLDADPVAGFTPSADKIPAAEVEQILKRIQSGTVASKDGKLWNKEWQDAHVMFDLGRKSQNSAFLMDDSKHVLLTKGGQTLRAVPQVSENPADGFVYLLQDPQRGLVPMRDLNSLLNEGWRPTNQGQLNKEADRGIEQQKLGMQAIGHQISAGNLALNTRKYNDEMGGVVSPKDQSTVANTAIDNLRSRQNDLLRAYADFPDVTGLDPNTAMLALNKAKTLAAQNLERAAMAEGAGQRARQDYQEFMKNEQEYQQLLGAGTGLAFGMVGQERPADPAGQAAAAANTPLPGDATGRGLAPVAQPGPQAGPSPSPGQTPQPSSPGQKRFRVGEATKDDVKAEFVDLMRQGKSKEEAKKIIKQKYQGM
jgi:hypothetical protein